MSCRAVFLDRDGVLNRRMPPSAYVTTPAELEVLPGVGRSIRRLNDAGYRCVVVTNQRGIARGIMTDSDLRSIHEELVAVLAADGAVVDDIVHCPHDITDRCHCRKPAPGMILDAAGRHGLDLSASVLVGDSLSDIAAADAAGVTAILVGEDVDRLNEENGAALPVARVRDLPAAVEWILARVPHGEQAR